MGRSKTLLPLGAVVFGGAPYLRGADGTGKAGDLRPVGAAERDDARIVHEVEAVASGQSRKGVLYHDVARISSTCMGDTTSRGPRPLAPKDLRERLFPQEEDGDTLLAVALLGVVPLTPTLSIALRVFWGGYSPWRRANAKRKRWKPVSPPATILPSGWMATA